MRQKADIAEITDEKLQKNKIQISFENSYWVNSTILFLVRRKIFFFSSHLGI